MDNRLKVGSNFLLKEYLKKIDKSLSAAHGNYDFKDINLSFLMGSSSVFSSNIEGNSINLNTFMNYQANRKAFKRNKEIAEIEDLIKAYEFAKAHVFNEKNLLKVHEILSAKFVSKARQGKYRQEKVGVFGKDGLVYLAAPVEILKDEMRDFCLGVESLIMEKMSLEEFFYYASQIHLIFAHIHPFIDGNGRVARLLEKWFLAGKLGNDAWKIPSERFYWENRPKYYQNLNLGVNYFELDYRKAMPFLLMLPKALKN